MKNFIPLILIVFLVSVISCGKKELYVAPPTFNINPPPPPPPPGAPAGPVAIAGPDLKIRSIGFMWLLGTYTQEKNLYAAASWRKIDGPDCSIDRADSFITKVSGYSNGIYRFELTAKIASGLTGKDTVTIQVEDLPVRMISLNNIPGQAGPFWDNITLNLPPEALDNLDYVMIRYLDNAGTPTEWIPALKDYEPAINWNTQRGYIYSVNPGDGLFIYGSIAYNERYDIKIYY